MKIAITSVTGQLGSAIATQLIKEIGKENVIGIARTPEKAKHFGIEIRKGDYNSREQFNNALVGVDTVLLVSGMDAPEKRIEQHRNVIEAAKLNGVKKIVYTSIVGAEQGNAFSPIVQSNRQTEKDIQESGLNWAIGRNGIYIEPDIEYIENYIKEGEIRNCAQNGKCSYTSRKELSYAYVNMLLNDKLNDKIYNLVGEAITQTELANYINKVYGTNLIFNSISVEAYTKERKTELGDFMGTIIAGIYEGILNGIYNLKSDFNIVTGRQHKLALEIIKEIKHN
ncbi:NAD(P)H-binding protein [Lacinutrix venerupis]|uniref:NAD(P)-dependent oxidoreductase n=1 Tax=Lacinutrix venerupis TaxID=1486034 RepID=A0AAC9PXF4_9FLAO|nr:NAD(P)H-binding protein [Lacinutrix venerupis]APY01016.1 NAD(P)-dependent oxidoreductase [Lacinutrix venerupis]